jgi:hypothetical protein
MTAKPNYAPKSFYATGGNPVDAAQVIEYSDDEPLAVARFMTVDVERGDITFHHNDADPLVVRAWIASLANKLLALPGDKAEMPVTHEFADGMYIRRLFIPKGTLLVGKIHKQACVNVVERGDISVLTETGSKRIQAGFTIVSPTGIQKVGFAHEDTVFTNIFRTDETDPEKVEDIIACESYEALIANAQDASVIELEATCL